MNAEEMWQAYRAINPQIGDHIDAWAFGAQADHLAQLVLAGKKTATTSAFELYTLEDEPLPQVGTYNVILDSQDQAVCIVQITSVATLPFKDVPASFAYKEGKEPAFEAANWSAFQQASPDLLDGTLAYWREAHVSFFEPYFELAGLTFRPDSQVVLEEFKVVYP